MKPFKLIALAALLFLQTSLFANYQSKYIPDQVKKDFSEGTVGKYQVETIPTVTLAELQSKGVYGASSTLTKHISGTPNFKAIVAADVCKVDAPQAYTSTIYEMDLPNGVITCMYAAKGDLYNPMGLYKVSVPEVKAYYSVDTQAAKTAKAAEISAAEAQFAPLMARKKEIADQAQEQVNAGFLTIPELILAAVLTDDEIIDIAATKATGKFSLKPGYTSKFTNNGEIVDNTEYILADAAGIYEVYAGLASVSMNFLMILVVGFGAYGGVRFFGGRFANKMEDKKTHDASAPYYVGLVAGVLLFFPQDQININQAGETTEYELLKTQYQQFEKFGYYTFADWANQSAKVIIDTEMGTIIGKSGLGTKEQIVDTTAQITQSQKLNAFYVDNYNTCLNDIYKQENLTLYDGKSIFGETDKSTFPSTEHWAYAAYKGRTLTNGYYETGDEGSLKDGAAGAGEYPKFAFSACGKADYLSAFHKDKKTQLTNSYATLVQNNPSSSPKFASMEKLVQFQYELYRDWGMLSVLTLPIVKMQAGLLSGAKAKNNEVLEKLNANIANGNKVMHNLLSSVPYMFIPGAKTVFDIVKDNSLVIGGATGAVVGSQVPEADGWLSKAFYTVVGAIDGAAIGSTNAGGAALGAGFAYMAAKVVLSLLPILGLVIVGVLRFIIIILKILSFHFLSLFVMPIMFLQRNTELMVKFSAKILGNMLELPIFVLSIWLAVTFSSLLNTIGTFFSKKMIAGMLDNNIALNPLGTTQVDAGGFNLNDLFSQMLLYGFDGFFEVAIAVFSIVIIYKIIVTLHTELFNTIDLSTSSAIDNSIDAMKSESSGWGARI